ncbi:MAG: hypothetical protein MUF24_00970 [Chitinophagaceae bacterium]|jgi:hypothetical protein|nr:hypothetical protein [Chitinophagaceae bacterium]
MKTVNDISDQKIPLVAIDKNLDKLRDKILFSNKLEKANKVLSTAKLPEKKI